MKKKSKHKDFCLIGYTKPPVSQANINLWD